MTPEPPLLQLSGVTKHYGGLAALNQVSFEVAPGEIKGLIGPNGAGKTTLLNIISGLAQETGGAVLLNGADITSLPAHRIASLGIARTYQNIRLFNEMTVEQNLLLGRHTRHAQRHDQLAVITATPATRGTAPARRHGRAAATNGHACTT